MPLPKLFIPPEIYEAAEDEARHVIDRALDGLFGIIDGQIKRRQGYVFAHEKALFHANMVAGLVATNIRIIGKERKIRRHARLSLRWDAKARARDPELLAACKLCIDQPDPKATT